MKLLYNIFIQLYVFAAKIFSFKNEKAKQWVQGRKNVFEQLRSAFVNNNSKIIWIHCASLGEFEQARPIIENLHTYFATSKRDVKILLTFFSPSGYQHQKNYQFADYVFYLPIDTKSNAIEFYKIVKPSLAILVKYEFWYYYITQAKANKIPLILVSGIIRSNQPFFKWYGALHREMLQCFTHFFLQNAKSVHLLKQLVDVKKITLSGDTRFDRVAAIASEQYANNTIEQFIANTPTIVAGSTWTEDDEEIDHFANTHKELKFIIAPHEITNDRLNECLQLYRNSVLLSKINIANDNTNVVIIDNIGMLNKLYRYATICYVGGGFGGDGVHNVLEAAVYGKPVIFGSEYDKFIEAIELLNAQGAYTIDCALEFENKVLELLRNDKLYHDTCNNAKDYVLNKVGASESIIQYILSFEDFR